MLLFWTLILWIQVNRCSNIFHRSQCARNGYSIEEILQLYNRHTLKYYYAIGNIKSIDDEFELIGLNFEEETYTYNILANIKCNTILKNTAYDQTYESNVIYCASLYFKAKNKTINNHEIGIIMYSVNYRKCINQPNKDAFIMNYHKDRNYFSSTHYFNLYYRDLVILFDIGKHHHYESTLQLFYHLNNINTNLYSMYYILENKLFLNFFNKKPKETESDVQQRMDSIHFDNSYNIFCSQPSNIHDFVVSELVKSNMHLSNYSIIYNPCQHNHEYSIIGSSYLRHKPCLVHDLVLHNILNTKKFFILSQYNYLKCYDLMSRALTDSVVKQIVTLKPSNNISHYNRTSSLSNTENFDTNVIPMYYHISRDQMKHITERVCEKLTHTYCIIMSYISSFVEKHNSNQKFKKKDKIIRNRTIAQSIAEIFTLIQKTG